MRRHARVSSVSARSMLRLIGLGGSVFALASRAVGDAASDREQVGRTRHAVDDRRSQRQARFPRIFRGRRPPTGGVEC